MFDDNPADFIKNTKHSESIGRSQIIGPLGDIKLESEMTDAMVCHILYRTWFIKNQTRLVQKMHAAYQSNASSDLNYIYRTILAEICTSFWEQKNTKHGRGTVDVPNDALFDELFKQYTLKDLEQFCSDSVRKIQLDTVRKKLIGVDDMDMVAGNGTAAYTKFGFEYVYRDYAYSQLSKRQVKVVSSYKGADDGSSIHAFRTGLEFKEPVFDTLISFVDLFQKENIGQQLTIRGGKELGHRYDDHGKISHDSNTLGKPLTNEDGVLNKSHEMGNCVDFGVTGSDGVALLNRMLKHSKPRPGTNDERFFEHGGLRFRFAYHGSEPLGGHIHCWMNE